MAKKQSIYVYPADCTDFRGTGLVGDLMPIEGEFIEEKNGANEITMKIPLDKYRKFAAVQKDRIIKADVPVRVPPAIQDDEYAGSVRVYHINQQ